MTTTLVKKRLTQMVPQTICDGCDIEIYTEDYLSVTTGEIRGRYGAPPLDFHDVACLVKHLARVVKEQAE